MWRVVCIGRCPHDQGRRAIDRGPLQSSRQRAAEIAAWLQATGMYERVTLERATQAQAPAPSQPR